MFPFKSTTESMLPKNNTVCVPKEQHYPFSQRTLLMFPKKSTVCVRRISQNNVEYHRMAWVEKDHNPVPTPCYVQGRQPPDQAAQCHIQPGYSQRPLCSQSRALSTIVVPKEQRCPLFTCQCFAFSTHLGYLKSGGTPVLWDAGSWGLPSGPAPVPTPSGVMHQPIQSLGSARGSWGNLSPHNRATSH